VERWRGGDGVVSHLDRILGVSSVFCFSVLYVLASMRNWSKPKGSLLLSFIVDAGWRWGDFDLDLDLDGERTGERDLDLDRDLSSLNLRGGDKSLNSMASSVRSAASLSI
jgi:hypothetical protein